MQEELKSMLDKYLKTGNHTPEDIKAEIASLLHGEMFPGEIDMIYNEIVK